MLTLTPGINSHIAIDLNLASKAHVRILLEVIAQPESLLKGEWVGICRGRNRYAVRTAQAVPVAVRKLPHATVDWNIIFQCWIAHMIAFRDFHPYILTHKSNGWHCSNLQRQLYD